MNRLHFFAGVALLLSLGCAGVKSGVSTGGSGGQGAGVGVDAGTTIRPAAAAPVDRHRRVAGRHRQRRVERRRRLHLDRHLHAGRRRVLRHDRQRLPGRVDQLRRLPRRQTCGSQGICLGGPSCVKLTCSAGTRDSTAARSATAAAARSIAAPAPAGRPATAASASSPAACRPPATRAAARSTAAPSATAAAGRSTAAPARGANTCGGGGIAGVCGAANASCTPVSCTPSGGQYCGVIGNGCGGTEDCGACANGMACATTGTLAHVCPSTQTTCTNLQCNLDQCSGTAETSISGTVYDPAGLNPLYNVLLYVPNTAVDPIPQGVSCNTCNSPISGTPVAAGLSDATGHFVIHNAPHGTNVPLVIQIGKWRRQVTLPKVTACQDNPFNDPTTFRLPKSRAKGTCPRSRSPPATPTRSTASCAGSASTTRSSPPTPAPGACTCTPAATGIAGDEGSATLASGATLAISYSKLFPNFAQMSKYDIVVADLRERAARSRPRIPTCST